jgi:DNA-binding XRE family transcriptional regulator
MTGATRVPRTELARRAELTPQTNAKMEKGLPTRKNSELKVAKALQKKYEGVFLSEPKS